MDEFLQNVRVADTLDILLVSFLIYTLLRWLTRRSAHGIAAGAGFILAAYLLARLTGMYLTLEIFRLGLTVILISLVIVFQQDIRQGFDRLSVWRPFRKSSSIGPPTQFINLLTEAVGKLAEERSGALIVLKGRQPLDRHTRGGISANASLSIPLLHSIFNHHSQGHDGAVVIDNQLVESFGVHLPLSKNFSELGDGGTRHAAALGLSEHTDALVIVVSEERGTISVASGPQLRSLDSAARLREQLESFYEDRSTTPYGELAAFPPARRLGLQGLALLAAAVLWFTIAFRIETVNRNFSDVTIDFPNLPDDWRIEQIEPSTARLTLSGPERVFAGLDPDDLTISLLPRTLREGENELTITEAALELPDDIELRAAEPQTVRVRMHRYARAELPIEIKTVGQLGDSLRLKRLEAIPSSFPVLIRRAAPPVTKLLTEPIDLSRVQESTTTGVDVTLPDGVMKTDSPPEVVLEISVETRRATDADDEPESPQ